VGGAFGHPECSACEAYDTTFGAVYKPVSARRCPWLGISDDNSPSHPRTNLGVMGISHQESGALNAGRQVSVWRCASACVFRLDYRMLANLRRVIRRRHVRGLATSMGRPVRRPSRMEQCKPLFLKGVLPNVKDDGVNYFVGEG
jgi:hypothetical protein